MFTLRQIVTTAIITVSISAHVLAAPLVDESELKAWGYKNYKLPSSFNYREIYKLPEDSSLQLQLVRSVKHIKGQEGYYYYFMLANECYPSNHEAVQRRSTFPADDKDYRLGQVAGNCVRIVRAGSKFETFTEQPRIFGLFNNYMDRKSLIRH